MKDVRPTSGRVLSALFSILGGRVEGGKFLDLFAGTGRVGLEALERGADGCVFVESVRSRAEELRGRAGGVAGREGMPSGQHCTADDKVIVLSLEVRRAISWLAKRGLKFDVIFADPPYCEGWCEVLPGLSGLTELFADDALMVIEHSVREPLTLSKNPASLEILSVREYGETCLTFLKCRRTQE
ncbi:MAG: RsmD family RNA methyltransferase [Synergistaceae bacterium]|nr:RsmD family RNA methyltransferase [Synergistaceae bacterium]